LIFIFFFGLEQSLRFSFHVFSKMHILKSFKYVYDPFQVSLWALLIIIMTFHLLFILLFLFVLFSQDYNSQGQFGIDFRAWWTVHQALSVQGQSLVQILRNQQVEGNRLEGYMRYGTDCSTPSILSIMIWYEKTRNFLLRDFQDRYIPISNTV